MRVLPRQAQGCDRKQRTYGPCNLHAKQKQATRRLTRPCSRKRAPLPRAFSSSRRAVNCRATSKCWSTTRLWRRSRRRRTRSAARGAGWWSCARRSRRCRGNTGVVQKGWRFRLGWRHLLTLSLLLLHFLHFAICADHITKWQMSAFAPMTKRCNKLAV